MKREWAGLRRGAAAGIAGVAIVAALLFLHVLPGDGDAAAAKDSPGSSQTTSERLLRLHDLPLGYRYSGGLPETPIATGCGAIDPAEPQPRLAEFLDRYSPAGCTALYARLFRVPRARQPTPLVVGTGALDAGSIAGAEAGLAVSRELLSHLIGDELPTEASPPETVGDATRLFHWEHSELFRLNEEHTSSFLVWRSEDIVAAIFVSGGSDTVNDQAAVELARRQQKRIEAPTPYTRAESDDTEVPLEDPRLKMPVYWLGCTFVPDGGLPAMQLANTSSSTGPAGAQAGLFYAVHPYGPHGEGLFVDLWSARRWKRLRIRGLVFPNSLRCPIVRDASRIRPGAAVLRGFELYDRHCRNRRHRAWALRVHLGRVVVTVETADICATCAQAGTGPYDSFKGMATIARGLERRIRPLAP